MSTDGNLPDLKFPQTGGQGNAIRLSASTLKQHGRNGELFATPLCPDALPRRQRDLEPPAVLYFSGYFKNEAVFCASPPPNFPPRADWGGLGSN